MVSNLVLQRRKHAMVNASNTTAPTQFIETKLEKYAYRRFGKGDGLPLLCLQPARNQSIVQDLKVAFYGGVGLLVIGFSKFA